MFLGDNGSKEPERVGQRFDALISYFDENDLRKDWRFFAYLLFILDRTQYFPIVPTQFQALLDFYGIDDKIKGNFSWKAYSVLLGVARALEKKLAYYYNKLDVIKIQLYMWVVSGQINEKKVKPEDITITESPIDFYKEASEQTEADIENKRIGADGEKFVYEEEVKKLKNNGLAHLTKDMRHIPTQGGDWGYDIKSFDLAGKEIHIEVKTTVGSRSENDNFILTKRELEKAREDKEHWHLYRVYNIYDVNLRTKKDFKNVVTSGEWEFTPEQYRVTRKKLE